MFGLNEKGPFFFFFLPTTIKKILINFILQCFENTERLATINYYYLNIHKLIGGWGNQDFPVEFQG